MRGADLGEKPAGGFKVVVVPVKARVFQPGQLRLGKQAERGAGLKPPLPDDAD